MLGISASHSKSGAFLHTWADMEEEVGKREREEEGERVDTK